MMLTLDTLAHRYGMLPTEVLTRATTLDITVMDVALSYEAKQSRSGPKTEDYDTQDLQAMVAKARGNRG